MIMRRQDPTSVKLDTANLSCFTHRQRIAMIKSIFYLIAADNKITNEEKGHFSALIMSVDSSNPQHVLNEIDEMDINEMFTILHSMPNKMKNTVLFHWIHSIQNSKINSAFDLDSIIYSTERMRGLFNLDSYTDEKPILIDMARRSDIDITAFLNGTVKIG